MSKDLASPIIKKTAIDKDGVAHYLVEGGLTKREYFAAAALQGVLASKEMPVNDLGVPYTTIERAAVAIAEGLLEALAEKKV